MTAIELWAVYIVGSLLLALIGFMIGQKVGKKPRAGMMWGLGFGAAGLITSVILWFTVGKKHVKPS